jgi:hypothetical protein
MLRRLRDIEWTFSNTAEAATAILLSAAVLVAILV